MRFDTILVLLYLRNFVQDLESVHHLWKQLYNIWQNGMEQTSFLR